ncbi:Crp/Fnr family transcriptional regulator [Rhodosalinus sediminis]|nr:Crp/Fnr family transcriptional regulator [Rhodosalinus sediminis]
MNQELRVDPAHGATGHPGTTRSARRAVLARCRSRARVVERGADLLAEGGEAPGALWVLSGRIELRKTLADGRSVLFDMLFPVDVVHPAAVDMRSSEFEATAAETSRVALLSRDACARVERAGDGVGDLVGRLTAAGRARRSERLLRVVQGRGEERLAFLLLELALRTDARSVLAERPCRLRLPQRAMGEMVGLSTVHVCRVMTRLAERGVLRAERGGVELRDVAALAALAHAEPAALAGAILA